MAEGPGNVQHFISKLNSFIQSDLTYSTSTGTDSVTTSTSAGSDSTTASTGAGSDSTLLADSATATAIKAMRIKT